MKTLTTTHNQNSQNRFDFTAKGCEAARYYLEEFCGYTQQVLNRHSGWKTVMIANKKIKEEYGL